MVDIYLEHSLDEIVDLFFSVTPVSVLLERMVFISPSTSGVVELEGPNEVVGLLEVRADLVNLLNEVLNVGDAELA